MTSCTLPLATVRLPLLFARIERDYAASDAQGLRFGPRKLHIAGDVFFADKGMWVFHFGAYGGTHVLAFGSLEDALEEAAARLLKVAPGFFEEPDYDAAAQELFGCNMDEVADEQVSDVMDRAEQDLTYTESGFLPSWEWTCDEFHSPRGHPRIRGEQGGLTVRIESSDSLPNTYLIHVDSDELDCGQRRLPYPTCLGAVIVDLTHAGGFRFAPWMPAATVPRGFKAARDAFLRDVCPAVMSVHRARLRADELRPLAAGGRFCEALALAVYQLRHGDAFAAGGAYEDARRKAALIHDGELRATAGTLLAAVSTAGIGVREANKGA